MSWSLWNSRLLLTAAVAGACASPQEPGSAGDSCFRIADCVEGLICIENQCSRDLSRVGSDYEPVPPPPPGSDAAGVDGASEPPSDVQAPPPLEASTGTGGGSSDSDSGSSDGSGGQPPVDARAPEAAP
jgi:hypothetical protein